MRTLLNNTRLAARYNIPATYVCATPEKCLSDCENDMACGGIAYSEPYQPLKIPLPGCVGQRPGIDGCCYPSPLKDEYQLVEAPGYGTYGYVSAIVRYRNQSNRSLEQLEAGTANLKLDDDEVEQANAAEAVCTYAVDSDTGMGPHRGEYRAAAYFHAVTPATNPAAATTVRGCATLCCKTDSCVVFSLTEHTAFNTTTGCVMGESCCSLANTRGSMASNTWPMVITTGVVQSSPETGKPPGATVGFDCAVRELAYDYARKLRPDKGTFREVHDALQLSTCGVAPAVLSDASAPAPDSSANDSTAPTEFFVSATNGSDTSRGTVESPFATIHRGIAACRASSGSGNVPCIVTLRGGGTFFLGDSPVQLTVADSGLTLRRYGCTGTHASHCSYGCGMPRARY